MKKAVIAFLVIGIVGAGGYGVYHHFFENAAQERVSSTSEDAVYVDQVSVITGYGSTGSTVADRYAGEVEPQATLEVKLENERTVKQCFVKEGQELKEGQRLFVYDTKDDEDKLAQAEIDIERAEGDIELLNKSIAQNEKDKKNASADDQLSYTTQILSDQNEIKQKEYEIKSKQLEIKNLKETISNATVTAEMAGIVQSISDPNSDSASSYSSSGDSSVYIKILAAGDYRIKGSVNEQNLQNLQALYDSATPVIVHSRVDDSKTWNGTISEIKTDKAEDNSDSSYGWGNSSDSGSSNYTFYVELDTSEGLILGQHVYLEADEGQQEEKTGMWLGEYYIEQDDDGTAYVWMANKDNVLEKHPVTLGDYDEDLMEYEIKDGLSEDDYITVVQDGLTEGTPVIYNDYSSDGMSGFDSLDGSGEMMDDQGNLLGDYSDGDSADLGAYDENSVDGSDMGSYDEGSVDGSDMGSYDEGSMDGSDMGSYDEGSIDGSDMGSYDENSIDNTYDADQEDGTYIDEASNLLLNGGNSLGTVG